jgi:hypothetical protein
LAIFELECCRVEGVRREEGARGGDVVCKCAVALAEARLVAGLEIFMLDGNCSLKSACEPKQALSGEDAGQLELYSPQGTDQLAGTGCTAPSTAVAQPSTGEQASVVS